MYIKHCKLSKNKQLELMKYFIAGATARTIVPQQFKTTI